MFDQASKQNIGDSEFGNLVVQWRGQDIITGISDNRKIITYLVQKEIKSETSFSDTQTVLPIFAFFKTSSPLDI